MLAGVLDIFEAGETALGSGGSPACIVSEAGQYSLAHYLAKMERNPSAARQKSTLTQLLEAVSYLHGRSMVRLVSCRNVYVCLSQTAVPSIASMRHRVGICSRQPVSAIGQCTEKDTCSLLSSNMIKPRLGGAQHMNIFGQLSGMRRSLCKCAGAQGGAAGQLRVVRQREQVAPCRQPDVGPQGN